MDIRSTQFVEFAYGDKRKDRNKVREIIAENDKDYDPTTDRYKKFRESLSNFESGKITEVDFKTFYKTVSSNKSAGYKTLAENYIDLKEDHALIWDGPQKVVAELDDLFISASWYLHTDASNQRRAIFLNFRKQAFPPDQERGLLTLLQYAFPESSGVGILNIQVSTLVLATRVNRAELAYLQSRAAKFQAIAESL